MLAGLSLAFATIPEELPILIKAVLAIGSLRLSKQNLLIKDLHAAETAGTVTTIVTDKTGTLTRNELHLDRFVVGKYTRNFLNSESETDRSHLQDSSHIVEAWYYSILNFLLF